MNDDTRRPDDEPEFDEPVFASDDDESADNEAESSAATTPASTVLPAPAGPLEPVPETSGESEPDAHSTDEPVFASDGVQVESNENAFQQELPESSYEQPEIEFSAGSPALSELEPEESFEYNVEEQEYESEAVAATGTDWVNVAPDSETTDELRLETEYNFFEETPAAEVAAAPPPTRKLGRTGPVWVLAGIALVAIVGLVWLGISRLTGTSESTTEAPSEPTVQQVAADAPTPAAPTNTPGPEPTSTPIVLPINSNVIVRDTDGQGVKLRAEPGLDGELVEIIAEGTTMVVLAADPDSAHTDYPVPEDGYLWYRMRVTGMVDGEGNPLIGWSASEFFVVDVQ